MRRRLLKRQILTMLTENNWSEIKVKINDFSEKDIINHLFTSLCSTNETCKWHGISAFGVVVPRIAVNNLESARVIMRRFLWCLNDESGGIGWGIPEAMGEVMAHHDTLFEEYCHMLLSYMREDGPEIFMDGNFLELPALQQGLLWGIGRLLESKRDEMVARGVRDDLPSYLVSTDKIVQGLAIWCLGLCGTEKVIYDLQPFLETSFSFNFYYNNELQTISIGDLAENAISSIKKTVIS